MERYIKTNCLLVKQTLIPNTKQVLEIMDDDAQGTVLTATFDQNNSGTTLTTNVELHFKGILEPFLFIPESIMEQELDGKINNFVYYAADFSDKYKKTVDDLYREILYRPADPQDLEYYSSMLKSGKMTEDDIRQTLLNSNEPKFALAPSERKSPDELKPETKDMINGLYNDVLYRQADPDGLSYYGSLLEAGKITQDDIKNALYYSDEGAAMRIHTKAEKQLDILSEEIFYRHVDQQTIDYYEPLLDSGNMTLDQVREELLQKNNG